MGSTDLRVWLGGLLCLNTLRVWLCLGLGWPRLGERLSGLLSILSLELVMLRVPCLQLGLHLMPGLQVRLRLGWGPGMRLRLSLGWGPKLGLRMILVGGSGLGLRMSLG